MNSKFSLVEYSPKDVKELFTVVNARQVLALMFHNDMADLFDFLGLRGFKRMHEYQYLEESCMHRKLKRYYINHHGMLLPNEDVEPVDIIPYDWYQYNRMAVTPAVRKQAVQRAMEQYKEWETDTKALYEKSAKTLLEWGCIADFNEINCLICDVDLELKYLERLCIELKAADYDFGYVGMLQDEYHERYKEKCKDVGKILC